MGYTLTAETERAVLSYGFVYLPRFTNSSGEPVKLELSDSGSFVVRDINAGWRAKLRCRPLVPDAATRLTRAVHGGSAACLLTGKVNKKEDLLAGHGQKRSFPYQDSFG